MLVIDRGDLLIVRLIRGGGELEFSVSREQGHRFNCTSGGNAIYASSLPAANRSTASVPKTSIIVRSFFGSSATQAAINETRRESPLRASLSDRRCRAADHRPYRSAT